MIASKAKSKMPIALNTKTPRNKCNRKIKVGEKFGIKVPTSTRQALFIYGMNNNTLWEDSIKNQMSA